MAIDISANFAFTLSGPGDVLLQFEAAAIPEQRIVKAHNDFSHAIHLARVPAEDAIGDRIWIRAEGTFEVCYTSRVKVDRMLADISTLQQVDPHDLPGEAVRYLFDSRFCPATRFQSFVHDRFGQLEGGARVVAMRDWIADKFMYMSGSSGPNTTALDSFVERRGICRDFAHVLISLARASTIPARYVSCFAPGVNPPDFHAVAEVFLADPTIPGGGAWHIVDATGMADPAKAAKIGVGRDAADVSFLTSFGPIQTTAPQVSVTESG